MEVPPLPPKKRLVITAKDETSKNRQVHRPGKEFNETKKQENMNDIVTVMGKQKQPQIYYSGSPQSHGTSSNNRANYASSQENINRNSAAVMRQTQQQCDPRCSVQLQRTSLDDSNVPELPHRPIFVLPTQVDSKEIHTFLAQEGDAPLLPPKKGKQKFLRSSEEEQAKNKEEPTYVGNISSSPQRNEFLDDLAYSVVDISDWRNIEKACPMYTEMKAEGLTTDDSSYAEVKDEGPPIDDSTYTEVRDEGPPIDDSTYSEIKDDGSPIDDEEYVPMAYIYVPMADQKSTKDMGTEKGESATQTLAQNKISEKVDLTGSEDEEHYEETTGWLETSPPEEFITRKIKPKEDERILPAARNFRNNNNDAVECSAKKRHDEVGGFRISPMKVSEPKKKQKEEKQMIRTSRHFQRFDGFGHKSEGTVTHHARECQTGWISCRREDDFVDFEDIENYFKERRRLDAKVSKI
ncbi:PREDICTED: uncharacterized protein LOC107340652 isoform X2 [Acropora digitifera]|uniref:uncharacterized protein LOC107340652 isoform X2 n=1 Tax=Acropora digitifera TaxID=70779 RepID=UPI00077B1220|nr:PREDICTED: uncharacterized protein LOC107340652 isoform X2 [Acropora digitifera]